MRRAGKAVDRPRDGDSPPVFESEAAVPLARGGGLGILPGMMARRSSFLLWSLALLCCRSVAAEAQTTRVTVVHFSDYHSHAAPFFSEHAANQAGIARAIGYLKKVRAADPGAILLSGGDMINAGTPAWSDKYRCTEWGWLDGLVDAMAFGNHDVDYGWDAFAACAAGVRFPILSGNLAGPDGGLLLSSGGKPYVIKEAGRLRIGVFSVSGPDFASLVKPANLPAGARFEDALSAARRIVATLRDTEKVDAVLFIGHQDLESDFAMAKAVPGIDVVLGSHSHYKGEFQLIPWTRTYFISPFQYLNYLSRVELTFRRGKLVGVTGALVKMDERVAPDREIQSKVRTLEAALEADPAYAARFLVIGSAAVELSTDGLNTGESLLGDFAMDTLRGAASAHVAASTSSSFRASIPPGPIRMEDYLTAIPYRNKVLTYQLRGAQIQSLLDLAVSKRGSDNFAVLSGVRFVVAGGKATAVQVLRDPAAPTPAYDPLDPAKTYTVMATDFISGIAGGYKDIFSAASGRRDTGLIVNDVLIDRIRRHSPVGAQLDGRVRDDAKRP